MTGKHVKTGSMVYEMATHNAQEQSSMIVGSNHLVNSDGITQRESARA